jgi:hypothetical protein
MCQLDTDQAMSCTSVYIFIRLIKRTKHWYFFIYGWQPFQFEAQSDHPDAKKLEMFIYAVIVAPVHDTWLRWLPHPTTLINGNTGKRKRETKNLVVD